MALLIKADGTKEIIIPTGPNGELTYDEIRKAIGGGWVEHIEVDPDVAEGCSHAYMDEEGKIKRLPANRKATEMSTYTMAGDVLCGDVLFCTDAEVGD